MSNLPLLTSLAEDLWAREVIASDKAFAMRMRMTVVRLASGGLLLHSPVRIDDALAAELEALGPVEAIIAPSCFHHLFASGAKRRYPDAPLWGAPGLAEKRENLSFDGVLGAGEHPWEDEVQTLAIEGVPKTGEHAFFHRKTGSLICTDFLINIPEEKRFFSRLIWRLLAVYQKPGPSRFWRFFARDRVAVLGSLEKIRALPIERIVMAHGDVIEAECPAALEQATAWLR